MIAIKSRFKDKRVLVTGHTGFKGAWLSAWLQDLGAKVSGIALDPLTGSGLYNDSIINERMTDYRLDIRRAGDLDQLVQKISPEIVFHLAAQPLVLRSYEDPIETFETNIMGTSYLLESLRKVQHLQGVVCITTDKVYENLESSEGYVEDDRLGGYDPYSTSKAASELVVSSYSRSFFNQKKVPLITVRAGNVIGGGDWADNRLVPDFFRALKNSATLEMRSPLSVRPWQHVMEPLSGYLAVAEAILSNKVDGYEAFNFGPKSDAQVPVSRIIDGLNDVVGRAPNAKKVDVRYVDPKHHETSLLWLNCTKSKDRLGWAPRLDIQSTLELTTEFYLANLAGVSKQGLRDMVTTQIQKYMERIPSL